MGQISSSVTLHQAGRVCQAQTVCLIGSIRKLQRKWSVVNTALAVCFMSLSEHNIAVACDNNFEKAKKFEADE